MDVPLPFSRGKVRWILKHNASAVRKRVVKTFEGNTDTRYRADVCSHLITFDPKKGFSWNAVQMSHCQRSLLSFNFLSPVLTRM
jgi:hypothetical protein